MVTFSVKSFTIISVVLLVACNGREQKQEETSLTDTGFVVTQKVDLNQNKPVTEKSDSSDKIIPAKVDTVAKQVIKDTIPKDTIPKNIDSLPVRKVGELILAEKIIASDNPVTFQIMDSLVAIKVKDRPFYFKVFNKIMGRADGALAEPIGVYSRRFVEKHTKDFFAYSEKFSTIEMGTWASQLGIELFLTENHPKDGYTRTAKLLKDNCTSCDAKILKRIEEFNAMVLLTIKENEVKK